MRKGRTVVDFARIRVKLVAVSLACYDGSMLRKAIDYSFVRYLIVGILSVCVDYGGLLAAYHLLGVDLAVATTGAFLVSLIFNFLLTKFWTFSVEGTKHTVKHSLRQIVMMTALVCFNLAVTNLAVVWLNRAGIGPEISKLLTVGMVMMWNFVIYKKIIFKHPVPVAESAYIPEDLADNKPRR